MVIWLLKILSLATAYLLKWWLFKLGEAVEKVRVLFVFNWLNCLLYPLEMNGNSCDLFALINVTYSRIAKIFAQQQNTLLLFLLQIGSFPFEMK